MELEQLRHFIGRGGGRKLFCGGKSTVHQPFYYLPLRLRA